MPDSPHLSAFQKAFGVDANAYNSSELATELSRFPPDDPLRHILVAVAAEEIARHPNPAMKIARLLEAHFGSSILKAEFFNAARRWLACIAAQPADWRLGGRPFAEAVRGWADRALEWPQDIKPEHIEEDLRNRFGSELPERGSNAWRGLIDSVRLEIASIVADRFCRLVGHPLLQDDALVRPQSDASNGDGEPAQIFVDLPLLALHASMAEWKECGISSQQATELIWRWALSLKRMGPDCWKGMRHVAEAGLEVFWPTFWAEAESSGDCLAASDVCLHSRFSAAALLPWWLLGSAHTGRLLEGDDQRIPTVVASLWRTWNEERNSLSAVESAQCDHYYMFAAARYGLESLAQHHRLICDYGTGAQRASIGMQLACILEEYSSRMAVCRWMLAPPKSAVRSVGSALVVSSSSTIADKEVGPWYEDPTPDVETGGISDQLPFIDTRTESRPLRPLSGNGFQRDKKIPFCSEQTFEKLTLPLSPETWMQALPPRTAFLGLYDLPRCDDAIIPGRPVVLLAIHHPKNGVFVCTAPARRGDLSDRGEMMDTAGNLLSDFDERLSDFYLDYSNATRNSTNNPEEHLKSLAYDIAGALEDRHAQINYHFGPLIEELLGEAANGLITEDELSEYDLVVCPRGMAAGAIVDLLGVERCLHERFRSISITPSLPFWAFMRDRSKTAELETPLRLGFVGWERPPEEGDHRGQGKMVRKIMELANNLPRQSAAGPLAKVSMAAESPVASLRRTWRMAEASDYLVIFGHGAKEHTGVRLADGVFPANMPAAQEEFDPRPQVVLTCACFGGRFTQRPDRADALNPLVDATSITLLLADQSLRRLPSLAGGFIYEVPGIWAAEVIDALLRQRLAAIAAGEPDRSGFGLARCRTNCLNDYLNCFQGRRADILNGKLCDAARSQPNAFLHLFAVWSLHLVGVEPTVINAI